MRTVSAALATLIRVVDDLGDEVDVVDLSGDGIRRIVGDDVPSHALDDSGRGIGLLRDIGGGDT